MTLRRQFTCPLVNGVHARPASAFEERARSFAAEISLLNERNQRAANGKSVLAIIGADIRHNDPCMLTVSGPDEQEAMNALSAFLQDTLPRCDDALPAGIDSGHERPIPPVLRDAGATIRRGTAVVSGLARGLIVSAAKFGLPA